MANGGHFGGGNHIGGHHGGGFSGGSGGYHGGVRGAFVGDEEVFGSEVADYALDNVDYPRDSATSIVIRVLTAALTIFFYFGVQFLAFSGFNLLNTGIFGVSVILFLLSYTSDGNTVGLKNFKGKTVPYGSENIYRAWEGSRPEDARGVGGTWISPKGTYYAISFFEKEYRDSSLKQVYDTVQRTPSIVWMNSVVWVLLASACLVLNCFFYRLVIPVFENATMTDIAFKFMDEFIFYLPSVLALLSAIACLVFRKMRHKLLYACAKRIVENNYATQMRIKSFGVIENTMRRKWFYNECPNCGTKAPEEATACEFCGSSLEVVSYDEIDHDRMHRLKMEDEHV